MRIWIVIADESRARIFCSSGRHGPLDEVEGLIHPKSQSKDGEIVTDRAGRVRTGLGRRAVSAMSPHTDPRELEVRRFASEVSKSLHAGWEGHQFDYVALVAPPKFLGHLRERLDEPVRNRVVACIAKELTRVELREMPSHLSEVFESAQRAEMMVQSPAR